MAVLPNKLNVIAKASVAVAFYYQFKKDLTKLCNIGESNTS